MNNTHSDNGKEIRIGVYVCHCGTNIAKTVDVVKVAEAVQDQPGVVDLASLPFHVFRSRSGT